MSTKKQVFITGASSEIMNQLVGLLDPEKFQITGLTRDKSKANPNRINWLIGDLNKPESYQSELTEADIIVHAAALTHSKEETEYFKVNYEGTKRLISAIPKEHSPKFVFISSRVAGEKSGGYGVSKLRAEEEVKKLKRWLIIRPSEVYGGTKSEGIEKTIHEAMNGGIQLCPVGEKSKMYPIHITDTVNAVFEAIFNKKNQTITLNGPDGYSFRELLNLIEKVSGNKMTVIPIPKWFLSLVGFVSKYLPMDIGFVPDQVERLYSVKTHSDSSSISVDLESYIQGLVNLNNG